MADEGEMAIVVDEMDDFYDRVGDVESEHDDSDMVGFDHRSFFSLSI